MNIVIINHATIYQVYNKDLGRLWLERCDSLLVLGVTCKRTIQPFLRTCWIHLGRTPQTSILESLPVLPLWILLAVRFSDSSTCPESSLCTAGVEDPVSNDPRRVDRCQHKLSYICKYNKKFGRRCGGLRTFSVLQQRGHLMILSQLLDWWYIRGICCG